MPTSAECEVCVLEASEGAAWDRFVDAHPHGLVCHSSAWQSVLEHSFKHIRGHVFVARDASDGSIKAGLPLYEVTSRLTGSRLVSIPFATLSDPLADTRSQMNGLLDAVTDWHRRHKMSYFELRTLRNGDLIDPDRLARTGTFKLHGLALDAPPDKLLKRMHRSCVQQPVRRALEGTLTCTIPRTQEQFQCCYDLYLMSRRRLGLPAQPLCFFRNLWSALAPSGRVQLLLAEDRGHPIGCLLLFRHKTRVSAEILAYDRAHTERHPTHFLFWHAICRAYADGYEVFDFGRTAVTNRTLLVFKRRWGTHEEDLPVFWYPARAALKSVEMKQGLTYGLAQTAIRHLPELAVRRINDFCYHHLG